MLALGAVMILVGALVVVIGLFTAGDQGKASLLGIHLGAEAVFLAGVVAALLIILGLALTRWGAITNWRHRQERKEYAKLSAKLADEQKDHPRPSAPEGL